jgi:hypothetical protein
MPGIVTLMLKKKVLIKKGYKNSREVRKAFEELNNYIKIYGKPEEAYYFLIKSNVE